MSLDGYIARENGAVDWLEMNDLTEAEDEGKAFFETIDAVLFGRKTYEKGLEMGGGAFPDKMNYIFTRSAARADESENIKFISDDPKTFVQNLKQQTGKNILLMGGGAIAKTFFEEKLIDELILGIQAKIIGTGIELFLPHNGQTDLELIDVKTRRSGTVQVSYRIKQ